MGIIHPDHFYSLELRVHQVPPIGVLALLF